ncbi:uncharacterized protein si:ch73-54f23.2 [Syngnathus scovelli]|uniref:uncharacterized protein si:ch73-54f23.2 n=1 Tax=Syngnathus scovelli TaxID=161590 RepID=UPI00210FC7F9|nr:uncharacterized protein LOC125975699 [Syngnathus scovelli]
MLSAAVWLMALLGPAQGWGPSPDDNAAAELPCVLCFRGQTLPRHQGWTASPRCHKTPGGHNFATLYGLDCDTAIALALRLSIGWSQEAEELAAIDEEGVQVFIPALLRGGDRMPSSTDSLLQRWDWVVSTPVRSSVAPLCRSRGGELYLLTAAEGCQVGPLWSVACCSVPNGHGDFAVGFVSETLDEGDSMRRVSAEELQDLLAVDELFPGGCGIPDRAEAKAQYYGEDLDCTHADSYAGESDPGGADVAEEFAVESESGSVGQADERSYVQHAEAKTQYYGEDSDCTQADSYTGESDAGGTDVAEESALESDSGGFGQADERRYVQRATELTDQADGNSSSIVLSVFSTALAILKAPLRPIFSRITQFPGQVTYVLQEDLSVLAALPGDFFSLFYLLTSDLLSWIRWVAETLLDLLMNCVYNLYNCVSSILAVLLTSCYTGVTGVGTLAGDTVGICGNTLVKTWRVSKFFGGRLLKQSCGYAGTVATEMGDQALALGGGTGRLAWRSIAGVFNMFIMGGSTVISVVDVVFGAFTEGFGRERETTPVHTHLSETE